MARVDNVISTSLKADAKSNQAIFTPPPPLPLPAKTLTRTRRTSWTLLHKRGFTQTDTRDAHMAKADPARGERLLRLKVRRLSTRH